MPAIVPTGLFGCIKLCIQNALSVAQRDWLCSAAWMEPEAEKLIQEAANVNFVDVEQYPSCNDIHNRCAQTSDNRLPGRVCRGLQMLELTCLGRTAACTSTYAQGRPATLHASACWPGFPAAMQPESRAP